MSFGISLRFREPRRPLGPTSRDLVVTPIFVGVTVVKPRLLREVQRAFGRIRLVSPPPPPYLEGETPLPSGRMRELVD